MTSRTKRPDPGDEDAETLRTFLSSCVSDGEKKRLYATFVNGAKKGDPRYQYALGEWLLSGVDAIVSPNPKKGFALIKRAAKGGVVEAAFALGICFRNGMGSIRDNDQALEWYHRAALLGSHDAMAELAKIYYRGEIVPKNVRLAKAWIDAANSEVKPISYYAEGEYAAKVSAARRAIKKNSN